MLIFIYNKWGLLSPGGKDVKSKEEILKLLEAVWESCRVAVTHSKGEKGANVVSNSNQLAD